MQQQQLFNSLNFNTFITIIIGRQPASPITQKYSTTQKMVIGGNQINSQFLFNTKKKKALLQKSQEHENNYNINNDPLNQVQMQADLELTQTCLAQTQQQQSQYPDNSNMLPSIVGQLIQARSKSNNSLINKSISTKIENNIDSRFVAAQQTLQQQPTISQQLNTPLSNNTFQLKKKYCSIDNSYSKSNSNVKGGILPFHNNHNESTTNINSSCCNSSKAAIDGKYSILQSGSSNISCSTTTLLKNQFIHQQQNQLDELQINGEQCSCYYPLLMPGGGGGVGTGGLGTISGGGGGNISIQNLFTGSTNTCVNKKSTQQQPHIKKFLFNRKQSHQQLQQQQYHFSCASVVQQSIRSKGKQQQQQNQNSGYQSPQHNYNSSSMIHEESPAFYFSNRISQQHMQKGGQTISGEQGQQEINNLKKINFSLQNKYIQLKEEGSFKDKVIQTLRLLLEKHQISYEEELTKLYQKQQQKQGNAQQIFLQQSQSTSQLSLTSQYSSSRLHYEAPLTHKQNTDGNIYYQMTTMPNVAQGHGELSSAGGIKLNNSCSSINGTQMLLENQALDARQHQQQASSIISSSSRQQQEEVGKRVKQIFKFKQYSSQGNILKSFHPSPGPAEQRLFRQEETEEQELADAPATCDSLEDKTNQNNLQTNQSIKKLPENGKLLSDLQVLKEKLGRLFTKLKVQIPSQKQKQQQQQALLIEQQQ